MSFIYETVLDEVVRRCNAGNMSQEDLQMSLGAIANYLREGSTVGQCNYSFDSSVSNAEGKEYISDEIKRVEDFVTKKLDAIGKRFVKVQEIVKANEKQSQDTNVERNRKLSIEFEGRMKKIEYSFKDQIKQLNLNVRRLNEALIESMKQVKPFRKQSSDFSQKKQSKSQSNQKLDKYVSNKKQENQKQHQKEEFDKQQKWASLFKFDGKTLTKVEKDIHYYQFVLFEFVPFDRLFTFKVKIVKSKNKFINIGVIDYEKQKQQQYSWDSNNAVCYDAYNGNKLPGQIMEGNGVDVGETVEVRVNRKSKIIRWMVNNEQRASYVHEMLGERSRKLMPYVQMCDVGDTIEYSL